MDGEKQNIVEFRGYAFKRVKTGLDESQVIQFLEKVLDEKDDLAKRQGHFASLMKLAEKTVAEADNMADLIKKDAEARAAENAKQIIDNKVAQASAQAKKEAEAIRTGALEEAQRILQAKATELQGSLNRSAQELCRRILSQTETLTRELTALQAEMAQQASALPTITPLTIPESTNNVETSSELEATPQAAVNNTVENDLNCIDVEIPPPRDADEIWKVEAFLTSLPGVQVEPAVNFVDRTLIKVHGAEGPDICKVLAAQTYIKQVAEVKQNGQNKVRVLLNLKSSLDEAKEVLSRGVNRAIERR